MEVTMDQEQPKPKREITEEQRQKLRDQLAKGRATRDRNAEKRRAEKRMVHTRTADDAKLPPPTTAERAEPVREDLSRMPEEQLTRRSREERDTGVLDIPKHLKKPGWDYQFISIRCLGEPTDPSELRAYYDQGWRAVTAGDMPERADPSDSRSSPIEAKGCRLYMRPMGLTIEAREEDLETAQRQMQDKAMQAAGGSGKDGIPSNIRGIRSVPVEIQLESIGGTGTGRGA